MSLPPPALEFDAVTDGFPWAFPEHETVGAWTASPLAEGWGSGTLTAPALGSTLAATAISSPWAYTHCMALVQWVQHYTPPSNAPLDQVRGWLEAFYHACEAELWAVAVAIAEAKTDPGTPLYRQLGQWGHCREQVELCEAMIPHAAEPLRGELRQLAGDGQRRLGHYAAARHHYEALLQEGSTNQDRRQILKARLGLVYLDMEALFYRRTIPQWIALLPEAEALGNAATIVEILQQLALAYSYAGRSGRSLVLLNRALDMAQTHGLDDLEVSTLQTLTKVYEWRGQPQRAMPYLNRLLAVAQAQQNLALEADVYSGLARANFSSGFMSKAIAAGEQSLALYRQLHYVQQELLVLNDIGAFYAYGLEQVSTALDYFQQAEALAHPLGVANHLGMLNANQAYCYAVLGQQDMAHRLSQTALTLANQDEVMAEQRMVAYSALARVYWVDGRRMEALALVWQSVCMAPPWRSINGQLLLVTTWNTLRQWPWQWWQAQFGRKQRPSQHH